MKCQSISVVLRLAAVFAAIGAGWFAPTASHAQSACDVDIDGDGVVGGGDLGGLLAAWGACDGCPADTNGDGLVNGADLSAVLVWWGATCQQLPWATVLEAVPNPKVVTNRALRKAIVATGLPWRVRDNASNIEMLLVPPGTFNMGCSASNQYGCNSDENPVHAVTLTNAFYMGRYEVTQAQFTARMGWNPSHFQSASAEVPAEEVQNRPVEQVSRAYTHSFLGPLGLRLPTEAEWEYAYRAGTVTAFHSMPGFPNGTNDDNRAGNIAWMMSNSTNQTRPVGGKAANALGFHDMAGNVTEWVSDVYSSSYYASSPSINPQGPTGGMGSSYVMRGGCWDSVSDHLRSSRRGVSPIPNLISECFGFRVARNP